MRVKPLAVSAIALFCVLVPTAAPAAAARELPLRMSGSVTENLMPDIGCRGFYNTVGGKLAGRPFGPSTWTSSECLDLVAEPGAGTVRGGRFVLKASGGSVSGRYETRAGTPSSAGRVYAAGTFKITEGAGRFKGWTGDGLLTTVSDVVAGTARYDLAGSVSR